MTDLDLDRLGELWRKDPEPEEIERLRRTATSVSRRAYWAQFADTVGAVFTGALLLAFAVLNRNPKTLLVAAVALSFMLVIFVRNRKLREAEIRMLTGTTEEMLDQSIERASASCKRARFNLLSGPLVVPVVLWLMSTRGAARGILSARFHIPPQFVSGVIVAAALILAWMMIGYWRGYRRNRDELERLARLREAYRRENDAEAGGEQSDL